MKISSLLAAAVFTSTLTLGAVGHATTYTSDSNIADFTSGVTNYATITNYHDGDVPLGGYTPTPATIAAGLRVFSWDYDTQPVTGLSPSGNWLIASFKSAQSSIRVFPNIDHPGSAYDGYQYSIEGSNDGVNWTPLFDTISVNGAGEPFTLGTYTGTAPTWVDNVLTNGVGPAGTVGYIADFSFAGAYKEFAFGTSTFAGPLNSEQELSGVAAVPEPATWAMMLVGFGGLGAAMRASRRKPLGAAAAA
jgi:hypothetical protein